MDLKKLKTRIAPTPSGFLHMGNALSFAITAAISLNKEAGLLLRIDDLDQERVRPEYVEDVFETLSLIGIEPSEGPKNSNELLEKWSQRLRVDEYNRAIEQLIDSGHAYSCGCSRKVLDGLSPNSSDHACRLKTDVEVDLPLRLRLPDDCVIRFHDQFMGEVSIDLNEGMPDLIIRRRDGIPAYQIASLVDDVKFEVNLIVRGADLLPSTAAQFYLAELLGLSEFKESDFYHHRLIKAKDGTKLSKSAGARSLKGLRDSGVDTKALFEELSALIGMEPRSHDLQTFGAYLNMELLKEAR